MKSVAEGERVSEKVRFSEHALAIASVMITSVPSRVQALRLRPSGALRRSVQRASREPPATSRLGNELACITPIVAYVLRLFGLPRLSLICVSSRCSDPMLACVTRALYDYDPVGEWTFFSQSQGASGRCIKQPDNENPTGEWNIRGGAENDPRLRREHAECRRVRDVNKRLRFAGEARQPVGIVRERLGRGGTGPTVL